MFRVILGVGLASVIVVVGAWTLAVLIVIPLLALFVTAIF